MEAYGMSAVKRMRFAVLGLLFLGLAIGLMLGPSGGLERQSVSLGALAAGNSIEYNHLFINEKAETVKIIDFRSSCGCTVVEGGVGESIEPGGVLEMPILVYTAGSSPGHYERSVVLMLDKGFVEIELNYEIAISAPASIGWNLLGRESGVSAKKIDLDIAPGNRYEITHMRFRDEGLFRIEPADSSRSFMITPDQALLENGSSDVFTVLDIDAIIEGKTHRVEIAVYYQQHDSLIVERNRLALGTIPRNQPQAVTFQVRCAERVSIEGGMLMGAGPSESVRIRKIGENIYEMAMSVFPPEIDEHGLGAGEKMHTQAYQVRLTTNRGPVTKDVSISYRFRADNRKVWRDSGSQ